MTIKKFLRLRKEYEEVRDRNYEVWKAKCALMDHLINNYAREMTYDEMVKYVENQYVKTTDGYHEWLMEYAEGYRNGEEHVKKDEYEDAELKLNFIQKKLIKLHDTYGILDFLED